MKITKFVIFRISFWSALIAGVFKALIEIIGIFRGAEPNNTSPVDHDFTPNVEAVHNEYNWDGSLNLDSNPDSRK